MSGKGKWSRALALALALSVAAVGCVPPATPPTVGSPGELGNSSLSSSTDGSTLSAPRAPSAATIEKGTVDQPRSNELTDYLRSHQLPLVGGQVVDAPDGHPQVILYGFAATDRGQLDAEIKTRKFMNDSNLAISNRIKVNPEIAQASSHNPGAGTALPATPDDFNSLGSAQSYQNQQAYDPMQQYQTQQYQQQSQMSSSGLSAFLPLLGLLLGGSSIGGGYGSYGTYGGYGGGYGGYGGYGGGYGYPPPMMPPAGYGAPPPGPFFP
jgi:hypothetical protein